MFLLIFIGLFDPVNTIDPSKITLYVIIYAIFSGLSAGIGEEVLFRGSLINGFMSRIQKESYIPGAVIKCSYLWYCAL